MLNSIRRFASKTLPRNEYDYIIVGGGSSGCVLANRLTQDNSKRVLLVEAGKVEGANKHSNMPGVVGCSINSQFANKGFSTLPQRQLDYRVNWYPRSRNLAGSAQLNTMVYVRGHESDHERWAKMTGEDKFGFQNSLQFYKKGQSAEGYGCDTYNGRRGYLKTSKNDTIFGELERAFIEAGVQSGSKVNEDFNGLDREGFGQYAHATFDGFSSSSGTKYLRDFMPPHSTRHNLDILTSTITHRCMIDDNLKCTGIEVSTNDGGSESDQMFWKIFASEVILCAGAINTPQMLLLSGLGPRKELNNVGVQCKQNMPGVGKNLQDHLQTGIVYNCLKPATRNVKTMTLGLSLPSKLWRKSSSRELCTKPTPIGGFTKIYPTDATPTMQLYGVGEEAVDYGRAPSDRHRYSSYLATLQQHSKGEIKLRNQSAFSDPIIDPRSLTHEQDLHDFVAAFKKTRDVFNQSALDEFNGGEFSPGPQIETDEQITAWLRQNLHTSHHPVSTARIGLDDMSVLDTDFKVKGVEGLRVADSSAMPDLPSGNTGAASMMLAEMCANDIVCGAH